MLVSERGVDVRLHHSPGRKVLVAAWVGHAVEWYEFSIFGVLAAYVSLAVFPTGDRATSLMLTWATFAVALLIRPLGGVVLSHVADRLGRTRALFATVVLMTVATAAIAFVPGYHLVGVIAPVLFVGLRLVQGFAVGGEMSSAVPYLAESVSAAHRARALSWLAVGTFAAALSGALIAAAIAAVLGPTMMQEWGWRIPFFLALPLGVIALVVRTKAPESIEFDRLTQAGGVVRSPLLVALRTERRSILIYLAIALCFNVALAAALSAYLNEALLNGIAPADGLLISIATYAALIASIIVSAGLPDRIGRRPTLLIGTTATAVLIIPQLFLGHTGSLPLAVLGGVVLAIPVGILATPVYLGLSERFPAAVRSTSGAVAFNIATAFASLVPVTTLALRAAGIDYGVAIWVISACTLSVAALLLDGRRNED